MKRDTTSDGKRSSIEVASLSNDFGSESLVEHTKIKQGKGVFVSQHDVGVESIILDPFGFEELAWIECFDVVGQSIINPVRDFA